MRDFTPQEIDKLPRHNDAEPCRVSTYRIGDPMFYCDSKGERWCVVDLDEGRFAKEPFLSF